MSRRTAPSTAADFRHASPMSEFDYLAVLISIVLGLGMSHVLSTSAQLVRYRRAVRFYTPTLLWLLILFLVHVQIWWAVFELRSVREWSFIGFMLVLAVPVLAYSMSVLLAPDFDRETLVDLRGSYFEQRRWFYALFGLLPAASLAQELAIRGFIIGDADPLFRLGFILLAILGFKRTDEWLHLLLPVLVLTSFAVYVGALFLRLA